ncbi:hypothetical protein FE634_00870 [Nocardioides dongxiaopingii]|uniref:hypothetical protein n=1 Tax=Nocardioides sp. S-1144 TaxID=2582905 RepID=UPI00110EF97B|nr:hypothetical protein [Nocardioides sp. S-1144]QCW49328.1 hypothetical protein FE634_00870 [Nocardioides sp. S-1144]
MAEWYRHLWWASWGSVAALAALTGMLVGNPAQPVFLALLAGGTVTAASLAPRPDGSRSPRPGGDLRTACLRGLRAGLVTGTVVAASGLAGWLILPLVLTAALTSPWFNALVGPTRSAGRADPDRPAPRVRSRPVEVTASSLRAVVEILDDHELTRGWRHSHQRLRVAADVGSRLALVNLRQAYLDEMERRHPVGFASWLASGARPTSDPVQHLPADPARTRPPDDPGPAHLRGED